MINFLGNPEPFFPAGPAFGEHALLSIAPGEVGTGGHGGQDITAEELMAPRSVEERCSLSGAVDRPTIVALARYPHWPWRARGHAGRR